MDERVAGEAGGVKGESLQDKILRVRGFVASVKCGEVAKESVLEMLDDFISSCHGPATAPPPAVSIPKPRRMQENLDVNSHHPHRVEHDEKGTCLMDPPCLPVESEKPAPEGKCNGNCEKFGVFQPKCPEHGERAGAVASISIGGPAPEALNLGIIPEEFYTMRSRIMNDPNSTWFDSWYLVCHFANPKISAANARAEAAEAKYATVYGECNRDVQRYEKASSEWRKHSEEADKLRESSERALVDAKAKADGDREGLLASLRLSEEGTKQISGMLMASEHMREEVILERDEAIEQREAWKQKSKENWDLAVKYDYAREALEETSEGRKQLLDIVTRERDELRERNAQYAASGKQFVAHLVTTPPAEGEKEASR